MLPLMEMMNLSRVQSPVRESDVVAASRECGSAKERDSDEVEAGDGHERAGHGLVATAESDDGVGKVSLVHDLDAVGDGVPGDERVPHGLGAVRQTVTERDILLSGLTVEGFISALSVYST